MGAALYLDTSVVLRATLEAGITPALEERIRNADALLTSRLSQVEASRALLRVRQLGLADESRLADAERAIDALWSRCQIFELTPAVCELARIVAPMRVLRSLDALHLATYLLLRRRIEGVELVTEDARLRDAALSV